MKKTFKLIAAALAAVTAMSCTAVSAYANKLESNGGKTYVYSDSGELIKPYTGWTTVKSGSTSYRCYYKDGNRLKSTWIKENGKRTYYIRSNGRMATGDLKIGKVNYCFGDDGKLIYGVKFSLSDVTESGAVLTFSGVQQNDPNADLTGGDDYYVIRKNANGKWVKVKYLIDNWAFNDLGYLFFEGEKPAEHKNTINWEWLYGKLPVGEYKLVTDYVYQPNKNIPVDRNHPVTVKKVYLPFKITENNSNIGEFDFDFEITKKSATRIEFNAVRTGAYKGELDWDFECYDIEKSTGADPELDWELYNGISLINTAGCETLGIEPDSVTPFRITWTGSYGSLPEGSYRIHIVLGNNYAKKDFYIPFKVTEAEAAKTADLIKTVPAVNYTTFIGPPTLYVTAGGKSYTACGGTSSWENEVPGSGESVGEEADAEGALHSKLWMPMIDVKAGEKITLSTEFGPAPKEITVKCWDEKYWEDYDAYDKYETVNASGMRFTPKKGGYIYEVFCKWDNFTKDGVLMSGNSYYSFFIRTK